MSLLSRGKSSEGREESVPIVYPLFGVLGGLKRAYIGARVWGLGIISCGERAICLTLRRDVAHIATCHFQISVNIQGKAFDRENRLLELWP